MRSMWLEKKSIARGQVSTDIIWDCLPKNPYETTGGCFFAKPSGIGYEQDISQKQVDVDYFVNKIQTTNQEVTVQAYFNGVEHLSNFVNFVGDFEEQMLLYFSPDGSIQPGDRISKPYYKPVVISKFDRGEMNEMGMIVCNVSFKPQSDVWRKDYQEKQEGITESSASSLTYPYTYPYVFDEQNVLSLSVENGGRETGCVVRIKNNSSSPLSDIGWTVTRTVVDKYGNAVEEVQRARFFVALSTGDEIYVDSNSTTQEAKVVQGSGTVNETEESVVSLQEPSWDYINFVRIKHGTNRFIFNIEDANVDIEVDYSELKEVI